MSDERWKALHGDCLDLLKSLPDESVDAVVTDPPYGLSNHDASDVAEALRAWLDGKPYTPKGGGFMNKAWDAFVPGPEVWKECLRVLKPGGHLLVFSGSRTQDLMGMSVRLAGFDSRDAIRVEGILAWEYGCLSEDTEILTREGWVHYHSPIEGTYALCYDAAHDTYEWQPIERKYVYSYDDTAYRIESDATDQVVSRNHRCLVQQDGGWNFRLSEEIASQSEVCVPVLEDLHGLLQELPLPHERATEGKEDLLDGVQETALGVSSGRENEVVGSTTGDASNRMFGLRKGCVEAESLDQEIQATDVFSQVQRSDSGSRVGEAWSQGGCGGDRRRAVASHSQDDRAVEPCLEGRGDVQEGQGQLHRPEVRPVSCRVSGDGPEGRVRHGASASGSDGVGEVLDEGGSRASRRSQHSEQQPVESDVVRVESGPQAVRGERFTKTSLARITPFHLTGKVWCVKVPTGAFVARRNGKVFVTGNSGFPKSHNVASYAQSLLENGYTRKVLRRGVGNLNGKFAEAAVDFVSQSKSREITHPEAKRWEGWGTALKPSYEPVLMFRKPLIGSVAENVLAHGTGGINIDGCRVATEDNLNGGAYAKDGTERHDGTENWRYKREGGAGEFVQPPGRWPPNTVLTHTPDCVKVGTVMVKAPVINRFDDGAKPFGGGAGHAYTSTGGGTEEIDSWECADGCAVKALDGQSGVTKDGVAGRRNGQNGYNGGWGAIDHVQGGYGGEGGASRFFPQFSYTPDDAPFFYTTKAGRAERDEGLSGSASKQMDESRDPDAPGANNPRNRGGRSAANFHPTVKPIALMRWLAKLVTPPGGIVLDPFMGSGTTGCAAMYEGFNFIGIEQSEEYLEIARQRIEYHALRAQGGVVNPWEAPAPEKAPATDTPDDEVGSLEDLFGFGE